MSSILVIKLNIVTKQVDLEKSYFFRAAISFKFHFMKTRSGWQCFVSLLTISFSIMLSLFNNVLVIIRKWALIV